MRMRMEKFADLPRAHGAELVQPACSLNSPADACAPPPAHAAAAGGGTATFPFPFPTAFPRPRLPPPPPLSLSSLLLFSLYCADACKLMGTWVWLGECVDADVWLWVYVVDGAQVPGAA